MAIGTNKWPGGDPYIFHSSSPPQLQQTFPDLLVACTLYEAAGVSGQVASHTSRHPDFHGATVVPSGLFLSDLVRPIGFSLEE